MLSIFISFTIFNIIDIFTGIYIVYFTVIFYRTLNPRKNTRGIPPITVIFAAFDMSIKFDFKVAEKSFIKFKKKA